MTRYKNSQTTSTKCQYQAAASNPKWWVGLNSQARWRKRTVAKKAVPIKTCSPWNPVAIKKVDPYTPSAKVKEASTYSIPCKKVKYTPRTTVIKSPCNVLEWSPSIREWWAQVTLTPEEMRTIVFSRGTWKGLNTLIPNGGQVAPPSVFGATLEWKKAQKNLKKKNTSETIKSAMPPRRPISTIDVWWPWDEPSREISRHHWVITLRIIKSPINIRAELPKWNHLTIPLVKKRPPTDPIKGHGDSSTMWYGWQIIFDI